MRGDPFGGIPLKGDPSSTPGAERERAESFLSFFPLGKGEPENPEGSSAGGVEIN